MKSVKNYSKKKSRVQQKVKSKVKSRVQARIQARIQARSNKKQINKQVNKNIRRGTKKVQRNKNKKVTKKNLNSRVNVSGGGGLSWLNLKRLRRRRKAEKPVHTIFFDVDGTLSDAHCNNKDVKYKKSQKDELITHLKKLKEMKVKLFILTRCRADQNLCNGDRKKLNGGAVESEVFSSASAIDYYDPILKLMDGVFASDVLDIGVGKPLPSENGSMAWAAIKTVVMEEYCKSKNILEEQRASVVLIDDDYRNARVANKHGFRAFHNNKTERVPGAALGMTNNALKKILKEMGVRSKFGFKMKYDTRYFFDVSEESEDDRKVYEYSEYSELPETKRKGKLVDLTRELRNKFIETIKKSIEKSKKVRCGINEKGKETLVIVDSNNNNNNNNVPPGFPSSEEKFVDITVVDEKRKPKNLIKRTKHDTVKFEVSDFFMNGDLAREALKKLGTQKGFALYFGSIGKLCIMLKTDNYRKTQITEKITALEEKAKAEKRASEIFAKAFNTMESTARRHYPPAAPGKKVVEAEEEAAQHDVTVATKKAKEKIAELLSKDKFNSNMGSYINRYLRTNITESSTVVFKKPTPDEFEGFGGPTEVDPFHVDPKNLVGEYRGFGNNAPTTNNKFGFGQNENSKGPIINVLYSHGLTTPMNIQSFLEELTEKDIFISNKFYDDDSGLGIDNESLIQKIIELSKEREKYFFAFYLEKDTTEPQKAILHVVGSDDDKYLFEYTWLIEVDGPRRAFKNIITIMKELLSKIKNTNKDYLIEHLTKILSTYKKVEFVRPENILPNQEFDGLGADLPSEPPGYSGFRGFENEGDASIVPTSTSVERFGFDEVNEDDAEA